MAASSGRRGSQDPRGLPKHPPPAPPPQGGRRGSGGRLLTFPSAWRPKKTERERGRAGERREGGETHEARRESKRERASERETPTDPALPSSPPPPPPPPRPGPTWPPPPFLLLLYLPPGTPPQPGRGPDLSSGSGRRWRRCGVARQASGEHRGGEGVDGGGGDGGGGDSDGGGGGVPGAASIVPLGGGEGMLMHEKGLLGRSGRGTLQLLRAPDRNGYIFFQFRNHLCADLRVGRAA